MRRHPVFVFDSRERFHPVAVESIQDPAAGGHLLGALPSARLNFPSRPETWGPTLEAVYGNVGYLRRVGGGRLVWLQYWLWYLHNPKAYAGVGVHEGDWEFVQVAYAGPNPIAMTCSQHHSGGARYWWDLKLRDGRPVVYVARDSHANFFTAGRHDTDYCDGKGLVLADMEWREFGPWASWTGRWGNSTGEGMSPQSPGCQTLRWKTPERFHSRARAI